MQQQTGLQDLERVIQSAYNENHEYMAVLISLPGQEEPELITNKIGSMKSKLKYYKDNYNDDLTLKHNPNVKIVGYVSSYSLEGLGILLDF